jgi:DNA-binding CsgD family transcriptional regulator
VQNSSLSLRASLIQGHGIIHEATFIMVIGEKVVEKHQADFESIQRKYDFTGREREVIKQISTGLSNKAIADKLFISEHTVKDHLKSLMKKMKVSSRNEIIAGLQS